jgi:hypothetical protein
MTKFESDTMQTATLVVDVELDELDPAGVVGNSRHKCVV